VDERLALAFGLAALRIGEREQHHERAAADAVRIAQIADDRRRDRERIAAHLPLEQIDEPDVGVRVLLLEIVRQPRQLDRRRREALVALRDQAEPLLRALGELEAGESLEALAHRRVIANCRMLRRAAASKAFSTICTGTPVSTNFSAHRTHVSALLCW